MLNYETLLIFVYFLILCGGQSTLNSCIRTTLWCHLFREKQKLAHAHTHTRGERGEGFLKKFTMVYIQKGLTLGYTYLKEKIVD